MSKRYKKEHVPRGVYYNDLLVQMDAKALGEAYNKTDPPKQARAASKAQDTRMWGCCMLAGRHMHTLYTCRCEKPGYNHLIRNTVKLCSFCINHHQINNSIGSYVRVA